MVSDFIDEHAGYSRLSSEEHQIAKLSMLDIPDKTRIAIQRVWCHAKHYTCSYCDCVSLDLCPLDLRRNLAV